MALVVELAENALYVDSRIGQPLPATSPLAAKIAALLPRL
jgi:hypothetical protein